MLEAAACGEVVCAATPISLATVYAVGRRTVGTVQARTDLRNNLQAFEILSIG